MLNEKLKGLARSIHKAKERINEVFEELQYSIVSREYHDNIIKSMPGMLTVLSPDTAIQTVNRSLLNTLGYKDDELIGKPVNTIFAAAEEEEEFTFNGSGIEDLVRTGSVANLEKTYLTKGGKKIPVSFSGSVMRNDKGKITGIVCIAIDITDKKKATIELEKYSELYQSAPFSYHTVNIDGFITMNNRATLKFFGYTKEELRKINVLNLYAEESKQKAKELFDKFKKGIGWQNEELVYCNKHGKKIYGALSVEPVKDKNGNVIESRSVLVDITHQKQVAIALQDSEEKFRKIYNASTDAIFLIDVEKDKILDCNAKGHEMLGYTKQELCSLRMSDIHKHELDLLKKVTLEILNKSSGMTDKLSCQAKDGTIIPVEIYYKHIKIKDYTLIDADSNTCESGINEKNVICMIARDITKTKHLQEIKEQEKKQRIAIMIDAQENERHRIAMDLHDGLGQLLTVISFKIDNIISDHLESSQCSKLQKYLFEVQMSIDEALEETKNIAHDLMPVILKDFGIIPALRQLCKQVKLQSGTNITFRGQNINERFEGDLERALYRIAQEALTNLVKHSKAKDASIYLSINDNGITLRIRDKGKGFDLKTGLYDPDFKKNMLYEILQNKKKKHLGFISMQERVHAFNGVLTIKSSKEKGTEITVEIPIPQC